MAYNNGCEIFFCLFCFKHWSKIRVHTKYMGTYYTRVNMGNIPKIFQVCSRFSKFDSNKKNLIFGCVLQVSCE